MCTWKTDEQVVSESQAKTSCARLQAARGSIFWLRLLSAIACELELGLCHFDVEQAFVQSHLDEDVFLRLPKGCDKLSDKAARLNKSLNGMKQASRTWHAHLIIGLENIGFEQFMSDVCIFRLIENGLVSITAILAVHDTFAVGLKNGCDILFADLNRQIPVKILGELKGYGGCHYSRDRERGSLTISQQTFAEEFVKAFRLKTRSTIVGGRGCNDFVPVLGGNGTKIAPAGDIFD